MTRGAKKGNQNARKYTDIEEFERKIEEYFKECDKHDKPYTMSGLAYSLGIDRVTLINYGKQDLYFTLVKKAKDRVQKQVEENAISGKYNSTFAIFSLKNNYGWKDQTQTEIKQETTIDNLTPILEMLKNGKD